MFSGSAKLILVVSLVITQWGQTAAAQTERGGKPATTPVDLRTAPIDELITGEAYTHIMRGNQLVQQRSYDEAIVEFKMALQKAGKPLRTAHLNMGAAYLMKGDYGAAADSFRKAIDIAPGDMMAHYRLGDALTAAGDYKGAEAAFRKVIDLTPEGVNAPARHALGLALYGQKRVDEAIAEYKKAIEQSRRDYGEAHYNLGVALMERGRHKEAEQEFRLAIEQEKKAMPEAYFNLAQALEKQGRFAEAVEQYENYLRLSPDAEDEAKLREYIEYLRKKKN
jgi:protein O-GlcNAc transferase